MMAPLNNNAKRDHLAPHGVSAKVKFIMALKSTIYKANINIANLNSHLYLDQNFTVAQHPSETDKRLMLRLLAWCLLANEDLTFTKGLCETDEPDLWQKNLVDEIELSIDLGLPDEKRIRKSAHRAKKSVILAYDNNAAQVWWQQNQSKIAQYQNVSVVFIEDDIAEQLAQQIARTMQWQCTLEGEQMWLSIGENTLEITPVWWQNRL